MDYDYTAPTLAQPSPDQVRAARLQAGHTQAAAAALVHRHDSARWREWERGAPTGRLIDLAVWELYLIKSGLRSAPNVQLNVSTTATHHLAHKLGVNT